MPETEWFRNRGAEENVRNDSEHPDRDIFTAIFVCIVVGIALSRLFG